MLKLQQLKAAQTTEQRQQQMDRQNDPMRRSFFIMARVNRSLNGNFQPQQVDEATESNRQTSNRKF